MIHLDTNVLIALPEWLREDSALVNRVVEGEPAAACSFVWYEFAVGPLTEDEVDMTRAFLQGGVASISEHDAVLAARLYNNAGRQWRFKTDALVAASAIEADAELITINMDDFRPFAEHGLRLLECEV